MKILVLDTNRLDFVNKPEHYEWIKEKIFQPYEPGVHTFVY